MAKGGQREATRGQGEAKGGQGSPKGGTREAKGRPRRGQGRPREPKGRPKGGQREAKGWPREAKGGQARPEDQKTKKKMFFGACVGSLFGGSRHQKSSQSRENDFLKTELSFEIGAHFEREDLAKPGQGGVEKPGQAREGEKGQTGEQRRLKLLDFGGPRLLPLP